MVFIAFHQIPGTQLPVPASWQYPASDMEDMGDLDSLLDSVGNQEPAAMSSAALYSRRQHLLHELGVLEDEMNRRRQSKRWLVRRNEVPWELPSDDQTVALIAPELGFDIHTLQLSLRVIPPGYQDTALHSHGEAVHYYLSGAGLQTVGHEQVIRVGGGPGVRSRRHTPRYSQHGRRGHASIDRGADARDLRAEAGVRPGLGVIYRHRINPAILIING
jgi:mannose-6-phosphate isomerase-like protein (cupin superfamily)